MTLPSSGSITGAMIRTELGLGAGVDFTIPNAAIRNLVGKPAGSIIIPTDFYGQTAGGHCAYQNTVSATTVSGTATVTGLNFGATAWNRRIFAAIQWACTSEVTTRILTSASIGGIIATRHVQTNAGGGSTSTNYGCAIISAVVPTGASGTVVAVFDDTTNTKVHVSTYRVTGLVSDTAHDIAAAFDEDLSNAVPSTTIAVPSSGLLFLSSIFSCVDPIAGIAFTGATERQDAAGVDQDRYGTAMSFALSNEAARTVSADASSTATIRGRLAAASFQLA